MLDQPVPNPAAQNPNIHTHKVFASVGLILIGTILAIAGIWWYVQSQGGFDSEDTDTTKVSTDSAKKDETADWKTYANTTAGYKISYPPTWTFVVEPPNTNPGQEYTRDKFTGSEGEILIDYGSGLGGGCGPTQDGQLKIKNSTMSVCIVNPNSEGGKTYNLLGAVSGEKDIPWRGFITVNKPVTSNESAVLDVVATIETTK